MDNKEAISIITQIKGIITNDNSWSDVAKVAVKEAFDLAIKALGERPQGVWEIGYTAKQKKVAVCNLCNCVSFQGKTNFCHSCGASMKGGSNG